MTLSRFRLASGAKKLAVQRHGLHKRYAIRLAPARDLNLQIIRAH